MPVVNVQTCTSYPPKGFEEGDHTYYTNSTLNAGQTLTLQNGQDTTLKGAQAQGDKVIAKVGGIYILKASKRLMTTNRSNRVKVSVVVSM